MKIFYVEKLYETKQNRNFKKPLEMPDYLFFAGINTCFLLYESTNR